MKEQRIVYMIDDDVEDQEIFLEILGEIDVSIKCLNFFNGSDALDQLLNKGTILPDFIFIDLNMPVMNGYEFLKEVKTHTQLTDLPVIIYTTSSEQKHKDQAKSLGASSFITKPSELIQLKRELDKIITAS